MRNLVLGLLGSLAYMSVAVASADSCTGSFAASTASCAQFQFDTTPINPCINPTNGTKFYNISAFPQGTIDAHTQKMAMLITNVFENGNTVIGYGYCENIGDGRGFTSGYVGFTSGTDDAYSLIKNYTTQMPDNALSAFIQPLATISSLSICDTAGRNNTAQLSGYCGAWQTEACHSDSAFRNLEIAFATDMYLIPSTRFAALVGITTNLGKAIFYDTIIQHGWRYVEPKINIWRIINLTGAMLANESEATYLTRFLTTRRQLQCCYPDNVWPFSADRSSDLMSLVNDWTANKDLANPVFLAKAAVTVTGNEDTSSDKTNCNGKSSTASLLTAGSARAIITAFVALTFGFLLML